jgi:hypothetical protein
MKFNFSSTNLGSLGIYDRTGANYGTITDIASIETIDKFTHNYMNVVVSLTNGSSTTNVIAISRLASLDKNYPVVSVTFK